MLILKGQRGQPKVKPQVTSEIMLGNKVLYLCLKFCFSLLFKLLLRKTLGIMDQLYEIRKRDKAADDINQSNSFKALSK